MASYYDYEELRAKAVAADATQDDINNLGAVKIRLRSLVAAVEELGKN